MYDVGEEGNGRVTGGVLAGSMELEKTVTVIACILANPQQKTSNQTVEKKTIFIDVFYKTRSRRELMP
jgi:hypothetical protein